METDRPLQEWKPLAVVALGVMALIDGSFFLILVLLHARARISVGAQVLPQIAPVAPMKLVLALTIIRRWRATSLERNHVLALVTNWSVIACLLGSIVGALEQERLITGYLLVELAMMSLLLAVAQYRPSQQ
jgi:hypothetical protein